MIECIMKNEFQVKSLIIPQTISKEDPLESRKKNNKQKINYVTCFLQLISYIVWTTNL